MVLTVYPDTVYLDTMVAVWLVEDGERKKLSKTALSVIEQASTLLFSPMAYFELKALFRKKVIRNRPQEVLAVLRDLVGVELCGIPMIEIVTASFQIDWTKDPGDTLIVAQAMVNGNAGLITSDRVIRANYDAAIW